MITSVALDHAVKKLHKTRVSLRSQALLSSSSSSTVSSIQSTQSPAKTKLPLKISSKCLEHTSQLVCSLFIFDLYRSNTFTEHDGLKEDGTPDKRVGTGGTIFPPNFSSKPILSAFQSSHKERLIQSRPERRVDRPVAQAAVIPTPHLLHLEVVTTSQLRMMV